MYKVKFIFLAFAAFCWTKCDSTSHNEVEDLINTDRAFSSRSLSHGMPDAFIQYAAHDVIKLNINQHPIIGKDNLATALGTIDPSTFSLTWEPVKAEVDGNMGYTFGNYALKIGADSMLYGNYVSIWKKQPDKTWKYILDAGNPTPGPTQYDHAFD